MEDFPFSSLNWKGTPNLIIHLKTTSMKTILFFSLTLFILFFAACDGVIDEPVPEPMCSVLPPSVQDATFWKKRADEVKVFMTSFEGDYVFQYYEDTLSKSSFSKVTLNLKMQNDSTLLGTGKSFVNQYSVLFIYNKYTYRYQTQSLSQTELAGEASLMNDEAIFLNLIGRVNLLNFLDSKQRLVLGVFRIVCSPSANDKILYFKKKSAAK